MRPRWPPPTVATLDTAAEARDGSEVSTAQSPIEPPARRESLTPKASQSRAVRDDEGDVETDGTYEERIQRTQSGGGQGERKRTEKMRPASEDVQLERLREAVLLSQQGKSAAGLPVAGKPSVYAASLAQRRVSPIKEEPAAAMSPTLDDAFASPLTAGAQTVSTESTESVQTIKGSVPPTPGAGALRTPSYPFPYIPGTPRSWSSGFHRPFTTLSPTVSAMNVKDTIPARGGVAPSGPSTPAAFAATFTPGPVAAEPDESPDEAFPAPSLYDVVLALNSEPGLDAWWTVVVNILRDWYNAERATLALPADATDLENVPWGQKASYNVSGVEESIANWAAQREQSAQHDLPLRRVNDEVERTPSRLSYADRPKLVARHSYAGFERGRNVPTTLMEAPSAARSARPRGPLRTVSHAPRTHTRRERHDWELPIAREPPLNRLRQVVSIGSASEAFSSLPDARPKGPYEEVFPVLRALDTESDPLLDSAGVIKVLERGRFVMLTRDYSVSTTSQGAPSESAGSDTEAPAKPSSKKRPGEGNKIAEGLIKMSHLKGDLSSLPRRSSTYEEYEQFPSSPWAQSPAPSPAIQADAEENPFFTSSNVDEESFNPTETQNNYAQYGQVEAIGIDKASTVVHIPLVHPLLSQVLPPLHQNSRGHDSPDSVRKAGGFENSQSTSPGLYQERRAPIAIISFLSPTVPYPQNLTESLKLLAPHIATSFNNAAQYTNAIKQAVGIRHRRISSNPRVGFAPLPSEPESLEDLLRLDIDDINASISESLTSPSDYSAHSRPSPGGSLQGTPGWDPGSIGFGRSSSTNTPALAHSVDFMESYFEIKKRASLSKESNSGVGHGKIHSQADKSLPSIDPQQRTSPRSSTGESDVSTPRTEINTDRKAMAEVPIRRGSNSPTLSVELTSPRKSSLKSSKHQPVERKQHTQLHSFGADFKSSFSMLPSTATLFTEGPGPHSHMRKSSVEVHDMLPPSERLLRIIIDSLPVQVFMAAPSDGSITWANSKYLVYRGQDSRQILEDPWQSIHPDDLKEYMDLWKLSLRSGVQLSHKIRLQRFDGQYRWFFVRVAPLKDKRQNIVHWVGTNMDFHEQHLAELSAARQQETAASEAKYRALANSSPQVVFAVTKLKGLTFCNSQWMNYSGQSEEQALGMGFMDYVHPEDLDKCRLPTFKEDGTPTEVPVSVQSRENQDLDMVRETSSSDDSSDSQTITSPGPNEVGEKASVKQLPQAKLSRLASMGILKVTKDAEGRPSYSTEVRLRNKEGNFRWHLVRVLLSELPDANEGDQTWYGTCTDINDHKLLEQTLKETMDAKSRFLSNMSHEIRTPLNGITGMVNFLIDSKLSAEQLEHVNIIRNSTEGLRDLINDILDLSKVEAGMITLTMDWLHVRSLIEEVNDLTSALAIDKRLELNYIVDEDVPPMVKGDRFRIRQVLLNVIGNAIKFTQRGEVFVRCQLLQTEDTGLAANEAMVQFEVIDTGTGFTEKEAEFLFKRFSQIDASSTRQHGGSGLGLAISMQLVELHGGRMKASSVSGKGSTFTFTIKFGLPDSEEQPPPRPSTDVGIAAPPTPELPSPLTKTSTSSSTSQSLARQVAIQSLEDNESPGYTWSPGTGRESSASSGSSAPSIRTPHTSIRSERSSASSFAAPDHILGPAQPMDLKLPANPRTASHESTSKASENSTSTEGTVRATDSVSTSAIPGTSAFAPLLSILVVCPLQWSREATVEHIEMTLPKTTPHSITAQESVHNSLQLLTSDDTNVFTHVVLSVHELDRMIPFMDALFGSSSDNSKGSMSKRSSNCLVIICDPSQRREIMQTAPQFDYDALQRERLLRFVFKPLKPSKLAIIFDPQKESAISTDRSFEGVQAVAVSQKQVYDEMKRRLGGKGFKVLLVEDNRTNQMVLLKFLARADIQVEAVLDGVQCTEKVFGSPHGTYSIILCDLHMPNKDGYQTCKEIRKWERKNHYQHLPIIALSANVLGDVYAKCVEAGFNSYVTKPVDFKELSEKIMAFLDPADPEKPLSFMKMKDETKRWGH